MVRNRLAELVQSTNACGVAAADFISAWFSYGKEEEESKV
jgi:hypothetical protein